MDRIEANPIALRAVRAVLAAAHDTSFTLSSGTRVDVSVEVVAQEVWPAELEGLDPAEDGAWPPEVRLRYRWDGGEARVRAACDWWKTRDDYRHLVGIGLRSEGRSVELVWTTFGVPIARATGEQPVHIPGALRLKRATDRESRAQWDAWRRALRAEADVLGLHRATPSNITLCEVDKGSGQVGPSPAAAFENLARLGLLKLVGQCRHEPDAYEGPAPFGPLADAPEPVAAPVAAAKKAGIWPLPGGGRAYKQTLIQTLDLIADNDVDREGIYSFYRDAFEVTGQKSRLSYFNLGAYLGLYFESDGSVSLTERGERWLAEPSSDELFDFLVEAYTGVLELVVMISVMGDFGTADSDGLRDFLGATWRTAHQVSYRRGWLLSLGLTERVGGRDHLTATGEAALARHAEEAASILARLPNRNAPEATIEEVPDDPDAVEELAPDLADTPLVLTPDLVTPPLGTFRPPPRVLAQCCAALSAGRHLLLVGPPGTGKTVLAGILAAAAQSEDACGGLRTATASADWTTFDTIGGYALTKDGHLRFRPGVFPRALAAEEWLLVDELNRADVDKAFGELMTVLSHKATTTPYEDDAGQAISIGPEPDATYRVRRSFRVIATMNTWDKTSLFRLSSALQRRFATVHVGLPDDATYAELLEAEGRKLPALSEALVGRVVRLFRSTGLLRHRAIGPAVPLDMMRYLRHCPEEDRSAHGLAEAVSVSLLSQLEGLSAKAERGVLSQLEAEVQPVAAPEAWSALLDRLAELFLHTSVR